MEFDYRKIVDFALDDPDCRYAVQNYKIPLLIGIFGKRKLDGGIRFDGKLSEVHSKKLFGKEHIYKTELYWKEGQ